MENIENNDTLLISEILNKIILPYRAEEIKEIIENEDSIYETPQQVIDEKYTRPLADYRFQAWTRYNETIELAKRSDKCGGINAIALALEMMKKRYLHPSIITACRTLEELYVYLDCLDKDELDDFKIFNIKYELHPIVIKNKNDLETQITIFERLINFIQDLFSKKGKRYIE